MAADEEIKLVAEEAVAEMGAPKRGQKMDEEGQCGKEGSEQEGGAQRGSRGDGRRGLRQGGWLLGGRLRDCTSDGRGKSFRLLLAAS